MQVVMCEAHGGPDSLVVKSVESPVPGPGEVKIRLRARGVSYTDVLRIAGDTVQRLRPWDIDAERTYRGTPCEPVDATKLDRGLRAAFGTLPSGLPAGGIT
jgi:hypothetical protein